MARGAVIGQQAQRTGNGTQHHIQVAVFQAGHNILDVHFRLIAILDGLVNILFPGKHQLDFQA